MKRSLGLRSAAVVTVAASALLFGVGTAQAATTYPVNYDVVTAYATGGPQPNTPAPGANVPCTPSKAHPEPVVLVHGTFENQNDNWQAMAPSLANAGYCVYSFTYGESAYSYGIGGLTDIAGSAKVLATFVNLVLASTGAKKVDIVGHSQGGMMPRYYIRFLGGASKVDQLIGLVPSNYGTTLDGIGTLSQVIPGSGAFLNQTCEACQQQLQGSAFLTNLNSMPTQSGVRYTNIGTTNDRVVTPYTNTFLPPGANVTNITWQSICPADPVGHVGTAYDSGIIRYVLNTLDPSTAQPVVCVTGFPA